MSDISHTQSLYAILDCNNFFASCERRMDPRLDGVPLAVLSSNDGCIIARSEEVKDMGIPMGAPWFKVKDQLSRAGVMIRSLNYDMYTDFSGQLMHYLAQRMPSVEVYSIDEAFLDLSGLQKWHDVQKLMLELREAVWQDLHLPVSIGVARTKTLAKVANKLAKKEKTDYVRWLVGQEDTEEVLRRTPIDKVWGIGRKLEQKLGQRGIGTAWELSQYPEASMQKLNSVVGVRTVRELRGLPCMHVETEHEPKKHIATSRSFAQDTSDFGDLQEALAFFVARAVEKLHNQHSVAGTVSVYLRTNRFRQDHRQHRGHAQKMLDHPTAYPAILLAAAHDCLKRAYEAGVPYKKAGVLLSMIRPAECVQLDLFSEEKVDEKQLRLLGTVRKINHKEGKPLVEWASLRRSAGQQKWKALNEHLTQYDEKERAEFGIDDHMRNLARPWW